LKYNSLILMSFSENIEKSSIAEKAREIVIHRLLISGSGVRVPVRPPIKSRA
jgi:hypothetical protein